MMMKNLIKTLGFILPVVWLSVAIATNSVPRNSNKIINKVCIESDKIQWWQKCATAEVMINNNSYACLSITSSWNVVELDSNGSWSMRFTCYASDSNKDHTFTFYCGNWQTYSKPGNWSASYTCNYSSNDEWPKQVSCVVDNDDINPSCTKTITVGVPSISDCGNGIIEGVETCDFTDLQRDINHSIGEYLDNNPPHTLAWQYNTNNWYYCRNCQLVKDGNFVYEPTECLYTDNPISIMNNEVMPFWWRLSPGTDTLQVTNKTDLCETWTDTTKTLAHPTDCHFAVYNWKHKQWDSAVQTFTNSCYNSNFSEYPIYNYFINSHQTNADGASIATVQALTDGNTRCSDDSNGDCQLWEYKIVLERVDYDVCVDGEWKPWKRSGPVCEVDVAITRPYAMQISTFNASPIWASEDWKFLRNFYDINWDSLLNSRTDLANIMDISDTEYSNEDNVQEEIDAFKEKYEKLAVTVTTDISKSNSIVNKLKKAWVNTIKKVPNQHIYFLKWNNGTLEFTQDWFKDTTSAYTIFVDWMDVEIEWNVLQYAMIITTKHMSFKDGWSNDRKSRCASWWQVVQWLYVAWDWFEAANGESNWELRNTHEDELWCPWWWLHVKWVLIWDGIDNIVSSKRSQLNSWFNTTSSNENTIRRERRQKIIAWASVLIEYSPSLWKTLPPWAEVFTESLEVYRK